MTVLGEPRKVLGDPGWHLRQGGSSGLMGGAWIKGLPAEKEQTKTGPGDCIAVLGHLSRLGSISG